MFKTLGKVEKTVLCFSSPLRRIISKVDPATTMVATTISRLPEALAYYRYYQRDVPDFVLADWHWGEDLKADKKIFDSLANNDVTVYSADHLRQVEYKNICILYQQFRGNKADYEQLVRSLSWFMRPLLIDNSHVHPDLAHLTQGVEMTSNIAVDKCKKFYQTLYFYRWRRRRHGLLALLIPGGRGDYYRTKKRNADSFVQFMKASPLGIKINEYKMLKLKSLWFLLLSKISLGLERKKYKKCLRNIQHKKNNLRDSLGL